MTDIVERSIPSDPIEVGQFIAELRTEIETLRAKLERIVYGIGTTPRLVRWHDGCMEWANPSYAPEWNVLLDPKDFS